MTNGPYNVKHHKSLAVVITDLNWIKLQRTRKISQEVHLLKVYFRPSAFWTSANRGAVVSAKCFFHISLAKNSFSYCSNLGQRLKARHWKHQLYIRNFNNIYITTDKSRVFFFRSFCKLGSKLKPYKFRVQVTFHQSLEIKPSNKTMFYRL